MGPDGRLGDGGTVRDVKGRATTHGAASLVNGIACGKGASFGIALEMVAEVELTGEAGRFEVHVEDEPDEETALAEQSVRVVLEREGLLDRHGARVRTRSEIPMSRGLKSSSAASNAIVLATFRALGKEASDGEVLDLAIKASFLANVTITGAFDDACATYFGNVVVTDNIQRRVLGQYPMKEDYDVIVHVPMRRIRKRDVDTSPLRGIRAPAELAVRLALEGDFKGGMIVNGLAYSAAMGLSPAVALKALEAGAAAAGVSGTGPATVVLADPESSEAIMDAMMDGDGMDAGLIRTKTNSKKAC